MQRRRAVTLLVQTASRSRLLATTGIHLEARGALARPANLSMLLINPTAYTPVLAARHVEEFVAYHSLLGVDRFYFLAHTAEVYATLQPYLHNRGNMFILPRLLCAYFPVGCFRYNPMASTVTDGNIWRNFVAHEYATDEMMLVMDVDERLHCPRAQMIGRGSCQPKRNRTVHRMSHVELLRDLFRQSKTASIGLSEKIFGSDATPELLLDQRPEIEKYTSFTLRKWERRIFKSLVRPQFCVSGLSHHQPEGPVVVQPGRPYLVPHRDAPCRDTRFTYCGLQRQQGPES